MLLERAMAENEETQRRIEHEAVCAAVDKLEDKELWSRKKIKLIEDLVKGRWTWIVDEELYKRRIVVTRELAAFWVEYLYDDFDDGPGRSKKMLEIVSDFKMELARTQMKQLPLDSPKCEIEEPIARYLAQPNLQNSYLTKRFCFDILVQLQEELSWRETRKVIRDGKMIPAEWFLVPGIGLLVTLMAYLHIASFPVVIVAAAVIVSVWARIAAAERVEEAKTILDRLVERFRKLNRPVIFDGLVFTDDLKRLKRLGVGVPSLLFSLFRITQPEM
jgi:hypothetical protein